MVEGGGELRVAVADQQVMPIAGPWNGTIGKKLNPKVIADSLSPAHAEGSKGVPDPSDLRSQMRLRRLNEQRALDELPPLNYLEGISPQIADAPLGR